MKTQKSFLISRRNLLLTSSGLATAALLPHKQAAANGAYPVKPIRLIVPFPPGGPTDSIGRWAGKLIADATKQAVVIENRPGAGGVLGTDAVIKSTPDGYTLGVGAISSLSIAPGLYEKLPYNPLKDVAPITRLAIAKGAIVAHPSAPFSDLKGLIAYAKSNPNKLSFASSGIGTSNHLAGELLASLAGIHLQHVPYKGTSQAAQDLLGGNILLSFESSLTTAAPYVNQGKLKAIAITTATRSKLLPTVPTVAEQGFPGFDVPSWFGLIAPAGTPRDIVMTLHRIISQGFKATETVERFAQFGAEALTDDAPEQFEAYIRQEAQRWAKVVKAANIKPE